MELKKLEEEEEEKVTMVKLLTPYVYHQLHQKGEVIQVYNEDDIEFMIFNGLGEIVE